MNTIALALGIVSVLLYSTPTINVDVINNETIPITSTDDQTRTAGLIYRYSIGISGTQQKIYINATTVSKDSMKSIGFKDISIEYSSDNSNWHKEKDINDLLKSDSSDYYLNDYSVSVRGGYYYRVKLSFYAKEQGLFGSSQSISCTSNSVWVS